MWTAASPDLPLVKLLVRAGALQAPEQGYQDFIRAPHTRQYFGGLGVEWFAL